MSSARTEAPERITIDGAGDEDVLSSTAEDVELTDDVEEDNVEAPNEDDPTLGRYETLDEAMPSAQELTAMRASAAAQALAGPHRVNIWDAAGPGSLAETLAELAAAGRLASQVRDDPETGPYIFYEPVDRNDA